jgi:diacylglycerol kinase family enzyme
MDALDREVCLIISGTVFPAFRNFLTRWIVSLRELRDPINPRNKHLLYRQLSAFAIETGKPLHVNLDGEPLNGTHFEFRCIPEALSVVLGSAAARQ